MTTINTHYRNATVGVIKYVDHDGVVLIECDDTFDKVVATQIVNNASEAMYLVDRLVCVYQGNVYRMEIES